MSDAVRIKRQLDTAFHGPAWHGPSLMENLKGVSAEIAAAKPAPNSHSIWEIVNHLTAWQNLALGVLGGNLYSTLKGDADWPPATGSWEEAVARLEAVHATLIEKVEKLSDERLNGKIPIADYSMKVLLRGIGEHNLYHAGQIGLLKRAAA
jgi:uncharacterized damage-inducible protein DinB